MSACSRPPRASDAGRRNPGRRAVSEGDLLFSIFVIFTGATVVAAAALWARQSLLVAYIALGALAGPWGLGVIDDADVIREIGEVGVIFLLFLLGANLHPQKLVKLLRQAALVAGVSALVFAALGYAVATAFGFGPGEALLVAVAMTFSSTIIGLKLLPTTALHHRHLGEIIISVLLLQDIIAILALLLVGALGAEGGAWWQIPFAIGALPVLAGFAMGLEHFVLSPLMRRFDTIQEYLFLAAIGWCLGIAELGKVIGLSYEMGAFVAGVALAANPVSTFIAESLKPLRDFFLITFFFALGAGFALPQLPAVLLPAAVLAAILLALKPVVFRWLLIRHGETPRLAGEIGVRLGQVSEFSLLLAVVALDAGVIGARASYLVQATTLITFVVSSYWVMLRYPTPIAVDDRLRQD